MLNAKSDNVGICDARVVSDKLPDGRITCLRQSDAEDCMRGVCVSCGQELQFEKPKFETVVDVACSFQCAKSAGLYREWIEPEPEPEQPVVVIEVCEKCGGRKYGDVYLHKRNCPLKIKRVREQRPNCSVCGGKPFKRGWKHTKECVNNSRNRRKKCKTR